MHQMLNNLERAYVLHSVHSWHRTQQRFKIVQKKIKKKGKKIIDKRIRTILNSPVFMSLCECLSRPLRI